MKPMVKGIHSISIIKRVLLNTKYLSQIVKWTTREGRGGRGG